MGTRKIKKSYISCTGYFASRKNKKLVAFESILERDFYTTLEFNNDVVSYEEQPVTVKYEYSKDDKRKYTPDVLVTYKDDTQKYFEVKYAKDIDSDDELRNKLDILQNYFQDNEDIELEIFTDKDIDSILLNNYKFLYRFSTLEPSSKTQRIEQLILQEKSISIHDVLSQLDITKNEQLCYIPYIWNFIFNNLNLVEESIDKKLTMNTKITLEG